MKLKHDLYLPATYLFISWWWRSVFAVSYTTMKAALLSMLCGIAIATFTEPYGINTSLLESRNDDEEDLSDLLSFVTNHIFSIQIESKHVCTGIAYLWGHYMLMTTALCAMRIEERIVSGRKHLRVRVCGEGLFDAPHRCSPISRVGINKKFLVSNRKSYSDRNSALIEINEFIYPKEGKDIPDTCLFADPGDKLNVVGFKFLQDENGTRIRRRIKYIVTCVLDVKECARLLNVSSSELPHSRSGACIQPCEGQKKFEKGDVGDPVYWRNILFGIIADIGDDTKPAIMIRPGTPECEYDFREREWSKPQ